MIPEHVTMVTIALTLEKGTIRGIVTNPMIMYMEEDRVEDMESEGRLLEVQAMEVVE